MSTSILTKPHYSRWLIILIIVWVWIPSISNARAIWDFQLQNTEWKVTLNLANLEIRVQPSTQEELIVSKGVSPHIVPTLDVIPVGINGVKWKWTNYKLEATLSGPDLTLSIESKNPGTLKVLNQPGSANGLGLIMPLAEGHFIPRNNSVWEKFLLKKYFRKINTNSDISLPLWGMDYGNYSLHWILTNPFNNLLTFEKDKDGIGLSLEHQSTTLAPTKPLTLILHLADGNNKLAGAFRYRRWLKDQKRFEPLTEKLRKIPENKKLIGASHIYLWGNGPISHEDVRSWPEFVKSLNLNKTFSQGIRQRLGIDTKKLLTKETLEHYQQAELISAVNDALTNWSRESWQNKEINLHRLSTRYGELYKELKEHFNEALTTDSARWGGGLSIKTIEELEAAGLKRLWLGLGDGWEGGLWHPQAVARGIQAGYLIAPYDSYMTALPPGRHLDWTMAHLGEEIHRKCGIIKESGEFQNGFKQEGHYTNPTCVRPFLKERIVKVQNATGFNSWFLDAYGSALVFDDYRYSSNMTEEEMALGNEQSMGWVGDHLKIPLGSEDANAMASNGLVFAHGMQTPAIGWDDVDMQNKTGSSYYLGSWYPADGPSLFFKSVPVKDMYKTVHFDPRFRLPLYQAVFHDSVVTTHQWQFDNLKLSNVKMENELIQLLYNVPPLYHLSVGTLEKRLKVIKRQDGFFQKLHERLATKALVGFSWRREDGLVQETRFEDGTKLVANFGKEEDKVGKVILPGYSVTAFLKGDEVVQYVVDIGEVEVF